MWQPLPSCRNTVPLKQAAIFFLIKINLRQIKKSSNAVDFSTSILDLAPFDYPFSAETAVWGPLRTWRSGICSWKDFLQSPKTYIFLSFSCALGWKCRKWWEKCTFYPENINLAHPLLMLGCRCKKHSSDRQTKADFDKIACHKPSAKMSQWKYFYRQSPFGTVVALNGVCEQTMLNAPFNN